MGVFELGRVASKRFSQQIPLTFYRTLNVDEVEVMGMATRHHLGIDPDTRTLVNSRNTQCTVSEELLTEQGFETRNASGDVSMLNVYVRYNDGTGTERTYKISQVYPDDTIGLIICVLESIRL